jgi:hypothetical protein
MRTSPLTGSPNDSTGSPKDLTIATLIYQMPPYQSPKRPNDLTAYPKDLTIAALIYQMIH